MESCSNCGADTDKEPTVICDDCEAPATENAAPRAEVEALRRERDELIDIAAKDAGHAAEYATRLARAEDALREIAEGSCDCCPGGYDTARSYFATSGDESTETGKAQSDAVAQSDADPASVWSKRHMMVCSFETGECFCPPATSGDKSTEARPETRAGSSAGVDAGPSRKPSSPATAGTNPAASVVNECPNYWIWDGEQIPCGCACHGGRGSAPAPATGPEDLLDALEPIPGTGRAEEQPCPHGVPVDRADGLVWCKSCRAEERKNGGVV